MNEDEVSTKMYQKEIPVYLFEYWIIGNYLEFGIWDLVIGI